MVDNASISLLQKKSEVKRSLLEAHRILKPRGLLELTVEGRKFYDGSGECKELVKGKEIKGDFYSGLGSLGFELLSGKNEGFAVSRSFFRKLKEEKGSHFAQAYERKLQDTYFILARKIDKPDESVPAANFWWVRPQALGKEEAAESVIDPRDSRNIITPRSRKKGGRPNNKGNGRIWKFNPDREVTVDKHGTVQSVKKIKKRGR